MAGVFDGGSVWWSECLMARVLGRCVRSVCTYRGTFGFGWPRDCGVVARGCEACSTACYTVGMYICVYERTVGQVRSGVEELSRQSHPTMILLRYIRTNCPLNQMYSVSGMEYCM